MAERQKPAEKPKPRRKMTKAEQSERFRETARRLGTDESGKNLRKLLNISCRPNHVHLRLSPANLTQLFALGESLRKCAYCPKYVLRFFKRIFAAHMHGWIPPRNLH
jgi:hypothetical protein